MYKISDEKIYTKIVNAETFAIITHKRPDGDAISSSLAIFWYLLDIGKKETKIDVIIPEFIEELSFIPGIEYLKKEPTREKYDLIIVVDCAELQLLARKDILKLSKTTICFDHHEATSIYANHNVIDINAPSCTCIIYEKLPKCTDNKYLNCIATGLISDTSNLTLNVTKRVNKMIEELKQLGVNISLISDKLSKKNSRTEELAKIVIERGKKIENSIFCSYLLQKDLLDSEKDLDKVNHKLIIQELQKKVRFESLILLIENDLGQFKGSLRTQNTNIDLNEICSKLKEQGKIIKGGGHSYSAGCTAIGDYNELFQVIAKSILNK